MTIIAFGELRLDEIMGRAVHNIGAKTTAQIFVKCVVTGDQARFQKRRADGHIFAGQAHAIVHRTDGLADLEAEIPKQVEDVFDHLLAVRRLLVGQDKQQIDIGLGRQFGAAVTTLCHQRHAFTLGRVGAAENLAGDEVEQRRQKRIHHARVGRDRFGPVYLVGKEPFADGSARRTQGIACQVQHLGPHFRARPLAPFHGVEVGRESLHAVNAARPQVAVGTVGQGNGGFGHGLPKAAQTHRSLRAPRVITCLCKRTAAAVWHK